MAILEARNLTKRFGGLAAVDGLDLAVEEGEIFGLIGPNGSGKTTALSLMTGFLKPTAGTVLFDGADVTGSKPHVLAAEGLIRTFQITSLFEDLTVTENVIHGSHLYNDTSLIGSLANTQGYRRKAAELELRAVEILALIGLDSRLDTLASDLSAGEHRYLEIGIALAGRPRVLLLDEPATGLNPEEAARLMALITTLRGRGRTIVLVEHNMRLIMNICTRIVVLNFGSKIAEGNPQEIVDNETVVGAYLGRRRGA